MRDEVGVTWTNYLSKGWTGFLTGILDFQRCLTNSFSFFPGLLGWEHKVPKRGKTE